MFLAQNSPNNLKAALDMFKSQCLKMSTLASLSNQKSHNASITKYRSYRQMKILARQKEFFNVRPSNKDFSFSPLQNQGPSLFLQKQGHTHFAKPKLKCKNSSKKRIKTEPNQRLNDPANLFKNRQTEMATYLQISSLIKKTKQNNLDLTLKNTKIGIHPRQVRHTTGKQLIRTSQQRPYSAMQQHAKQRCSLAKNEEAEMFTKYTALYESPQMGVKERVQRKTANAAENRVLSAWQIQNEDESFLQQYRSSQKKKKRLKRKNFTKVKQKS